MSSLPSCVTSALRLRDELSTAATAAPPTRNDTGNTITMTTTTMIGPKSMPAFLSEERPRFDFDERADREFCDTDGRARGTVITELGDIHLVHQRVVTHVAQEHRRLHDVLQRR